MFTDASSGETLINMINLIKRSINQKIEIETEKEKDEWREREEDIVG